jgi:hypothetical protein
MATKQMMISAPVIVLLYDVCFVRRSVRDALAARPFLYAGLSAALAIVPTLLLLGLQPTAVGWWRGVGPFDYALDQSRMITRYLRLTFWPDPLVIDYGEAATVALRDAWREVCVIAALLVVTGIALVRKPPIGFLGAWFFLILAPSSSFVPIVSEVGAERRMYLPLVAVIALVVVLLRSRATPTIGAMLAAVAGALLIVRTVDRNIDYADPVILWRSAARTIPKNPRAHNSLGATLGSHGELAEAIAEFNEALRLRPDYVNARRNLALTTRKIETAKSDE